MQLTERWENMLAETVRLQSFMDQLGTSAAAGYRAQGGEIFCAKGCSSCCTLAVNCTAGEALLLAGALDEEQKKSLARYIEKLKAGVDGAADLKSYLRMHRRDLGGCPFLADNSCGVYSARPLSCRALLSTRESRWCGADFSCLDSTEKQAYLDSLDRTATAFPLHYLAATRDAGQNLEAGASLQMLKEFGVSLYGSMPVLVHLFTDCSLLESLERGGDACLEIAAAAGLDSPFLLQIEKL